MAYPNFAGGVNAVSGYGDQWKIGFIGTWAAGDYWSIAVTSTQGNMTWGVGNLHALTPSVCMTYNRRVYVGEGSQFNFSDNNDPTSWEEQAPGAGFIPYLSQYGGQDAIFGLAILQGRLAVIARRSIQIWTVDADPSNFALAQALDNIGTQFPLGVQQVGDFDVLFPDDTGIRSLRSREVTLNAYVDDIGSAIDTLIIAAYQNNTSPVCGIVDPATKNYWLSLNGTIYVFTRHQANKIAAWGTYLPVGDDNVTFVPQKFVVFNGQVYCRSVAGGHYRYGGSDNTTYDNHTPVTVQTPWLDDKCPDNLKIAGAINTVQAGKWQVSIGMDPQSATMNIAVPTRGSNTTPAALTDSTYDLGNYTCPGLKGTHFSIQCVSTPGSAKLPAILSALTFHYNDGGKA